MSNRGGGILAARRAERGLTIDAAAEATRIPVAHLEAIEAGDLEALPPPPYRLGYVRAYYAFLGLEPDPELVALAGGAEPSDASISAGSLWTARIAAGLACVLLIGLVGWQLSAGGPPAADTAGGPVDDHAPDQVVRLMARRTAHFKVLVDGEVVLDRKLPGGESVEVAGHNRVEVHVEGADSARVEYNGDLIVPQGRQDVPRRLVFIDDLEGE